MSSQSAEARIEKTVTLKASPAAVWKAISDAEELVRWFPLQARVEPRVGGKFWLAWGEDCAMDSRIELWEPERRLRTTVEVPANEGSPPTKLVVDYFIEGKAGDVTVLRLVHSGFGKTEDWGEEIGSLDRGWTWFLVQLRHYLERHAGTPRRAFWAKAQRTLSVDEAWQRLGAATGLSALPKELRAGDSYELNMSTGQSLRGRVLLNAAPYHFAATIESLGDAAFLAEVEPGRDGVMVSLLLSTYGQDPAVVNHWQAAWMQLISETFGPDTGLETTEHARSLNAAQHIEPPQPS